MKTASAALKTHMASEVTTLATLWKVTRADAQVFGFTDYDQSITYSGVTYQAASGFTPTSIATTSTLSVDNLEVQAMLTSSVITEADLEAGLWDFAVVEIMVINYMDTAQGHMLLRKGWLGNVRTGRDVFIAEMRGMMQPLQQTIGRIYAPACDATLGDSRCAVALGPFTVTGAVTTATSSQVFTDTARIEATGYFDGGLLTWTSGLNNTYQMEVKTSTSSGIITLQQGMPNATVIGDTYSLIAGCDKILSTCKTKFNNVINFRGFPHIPGMDKMVSGK